MLKFFKCSKCDWKTYCRPKQVRPEMKCGAVVQYIIADDPTVGQEGPIQSLGMKPLGCGGKMVEISEEEAMSYERTSKKDN